MLRKVLAVSLVIGLAHSISALADTPAANSKLSAAAIVEKNVAARGGLQAWRAVQSISESGKLGAGGDQRGTVLPQPVAPPGSHSKPLPIPASPRLAKEAELPFVMEMERPRKVRLELQFAGKTAIQVYDGTNGWKVRPYLNRLDVEPFTDDEAKIASTQFELDGPLVDYVAKGNVVELDGTEKVNDRNTYKLKVTTKSGYVAHVWIDAETFLEAKIDGQPRRLDGRMHPVEIYFRDYRSVNGLQIPFVLETHVLPLENAGKGMRATSYPPESIAIDKVVVNPKLDASRFTKPEIGTSTVRHQGL
jgi:hypothetical protein